MDKKATQTTKLRRFDGEIQVIFGPMFSGKSTELLRRIRRYTVARRTCILINYLGDVRYDVSDGGLVMDLKNVINPHEPEEEEDDDAVKQSSSSEENNSNNLSKSAHIVTHEKLAMKSHGEKTLKGFRKRINGRFDDVDVIGIDEGQFFPDICKFAEKWANMGKIVIVAALDATFQRKGFNDILNLLPLAEEVTKLTSVCHFCAKNASFSLRIGSSKDIEDIGGEDKYLAVCRRCYHEHYILVGDEEK